MKFLHLADLHIGKRFHEVSLLADQDYILAQIAELAATHGVDAVLIAGDIYQKSMPSAEAMALFDAFLARLTAAGIKVYAISGNHDSEQRIAYFSSLIKAAGVYVSEGFDGTLQQHTLTDAYGEICISMLPFLKPVQVRRHYPQEDIETYEEAVKAVLAHSEIDPAKRNILIAHQFITGASTSDSEELVIGGLDQISADLFADFDYVALGHLHGPQQIRRETLRYAGSPLKYSFSEVHHHKSVPLVEFREKGSLEIQLLPLQPRREVRELTGTLSQILSMEPSDDYVHVTITDELVSPDARNDVQVIFPNLLKFGVRNSRTETMQDVSPEEMVEQRNMEQLFDSFYRYMNADVPPTEAHFELLREVLTELEDAEDETD